MTGDQLLKHARVYTLADKFGLAVLKNLASSKIHCVNSTAKGEIAYARYVYEFTGTEDTSIRAPVANFWATRSHTLRAEAEDEFRSLCLEFPQFGYDVLSESLLTCFRLLYTDAVLSSQPASSTRSSSASVTRRWHPARAARASVPATAAPLPPLDSLSRKNWRRGSDEKRGWETGTQRKSSKRKKNNEAKCRRWPWPQTHLPLAGYRCNGHPTCKRSFLCSLGRGKALACPFLSGSVFAQAWKLVGSPAFPNATRTTELAGFGAFCSALDRTG